MRDFSVSLMMRERERPSPKVWQPWYMEEAEGGGKELPSRAQREQRARDRLTIPRHPHVSIHHTPSPGCSSEEDEINVVDSPPPPPTHTHGHYAHFYAHDDMEERPLDMSTKRRSPSPSHMAALRTHTHNSPSPPPYLPRQHYLPRPSVITCVPPKYPVTPPHAHREPPPYSVATALISQQRAARRVPHQPQEPRRQVMQAGPVDPEIDEHFRRSLGQDYHHLFAASAAHTDPSSDSVDDHFAKALGETWTKLQAERKDPTTTTTTTTTTDIDTDTCGEGVEGGGGGEGEGGGGGRGGGDETAEVRSPQHNVTSSSSSSSTSSSINTSPRLVST